MVVVDKLNWSGIWFVANELFAATGSNGAAAQGRRNIAAQAQGDLLQAAWQKVRLHDPGQVAASVKDAALLEPPRLRHRLECFVDYNLTARRLAAGLAPSNDGLVGKIVLHRHVDPRAADGIGLSGPEYRQVVGQRDPPKKCSQGVEAVLAFAGDLEAPVDFGRTWFVQLKHFRTVCHQDDWSIIQCWQVQSRCRCRLRCVWKVGRTAIRGGSPMGVSDASIGAATNADPGDSRPGHWGACCR